MTTVRFPYLMKAPGGSTVDLMPLLPLELRRNSQRFRSIALVDSGATMNVLPYSLGATLGVDWNSLPSSTSIGGAGGHVQAKIIAAEAIINGFPPVPLLFSWLQSDSFPFVLGQTNFFMAFDVCFYRSQMYFELTYPPMTP